MPDVESRPRNQWIKAKLWNSTSQVLQLPDKTKHTTSVAACPTAPYVAVSSANPSSAIFLVQNNAPPSGCVVADFDSKRPASFVSTSGVSVASSTIFGPTNMSVPSQPHMKLVQTIALPHPVHHLSFAGSPAGVPSYLTSTQADPNGWPMSAEPRQLLASSNQG